MVVHRDDDYQGEASMQLLSAWTRTDTGSNRGGLSRIAIATLAILGTAGCVSRTEISDESLQRIREEIAKSPDARTVIDGNNQFALDLYTRLRAEQAGNLFFAPCSISTALAMTYGGARGETEAQMAKVLRFTLPQEVVHSTFTLLHQVMSSGSEKRGYRLHEANRLWGQQGFNFLSGFLVLTRDHYGAELGQVDFMRQREQTRQTINSWIAKQTEDKIRDLIPENMLDEMTRLVLTNAVYFKGDWTEPFNVKVTKDAPFHVTARQEIQVPLMFRKSDYRYAAGEGLKMLELTYGNGDLSMLVLLPDAIEGLAALEAKLTADSLNRWLMGMRRHEVEVYLPRFKLTSQFDLGDILKSMGMTLAFTPIRPISRDGWEEGSLHLGGDSQGIRRCQRGGNRSCRRNRDWHQRRRLQSTPAVFRADHPFLFLIRHNQTGSILFLGRGSESEGVNRPFLDDLGRTAGGGLV